jgi:hypothetical protein
MRVLQRRILKNEMVAINENGLKRLELSKWHTHVCVYLKIIVIFLTAGIVLVATLDKIMRNM